MIYANLKKKLERRREDKLQTLYDLELDFVKWKIDSKTGEIIDTKTGEVIERMPQKKMSLGIVM